MSAPKPASFGTSVFAEIKACISRDVSHNVNLRYATESPRFLPGVTSNDSGGIVQSVRVLFPVTGFWSNRSTGTIKLPAGEGGVGAAHPFLIQR